MKLTILLSAVFWMLGCTLQAQVGINTQDPKGVLHIDAGIIGDVADDVIVTPKGYIGVGTDAPSTRLDIRSSVKGKAISIKDGNQAPGKTLMSDADGNASWATIIGGWSASISDGGVGASNWLTSFHSVPFTKSYNSNPGVGIVNPSLGAIQVPYTGTYRLRLLGTFQNSRQTGSFIALFHAKLNNNTICWAPHTCGFNGLVHSTPGFVTNIKLQANDIITIGINQSVKEYADIVSNATFKIDFLY